MQILIILLVIFVAWSIWGYFSSMVEQAQYTVVSKSNGYEVRNYPAHIVAQTTVEGNYRDSMNQGFRIVAGYIFGGNTKRESIAMTAPVIERQSEKVAMTAPVLATMDGNSHIIAFGMPKSKTMETLPVPNDPRVKLVEIPEKKMAVLKFSWYRTDARVQNMKNKLLAALAKDNVEVVSSVSYAGYNAPWTPPWMNHNEVLVEIR